MEPWMLVEPTVSFFTDPISEHSVIINGQDVVASESIYTFQFIMLQTEF